ncbi:MAG: hypothetical protein PUB99_10800, partial [Oscillospiraceae bacterium]|nr:hypothetical protein [Oscillospiraceae bacterium]
MKSMKKILSLLLAVVLVVGCMTVAVWAEGEKKLVGSITITVKQDIAGLKCSDFKDFIHVTEPMVGFNDGKPSVSAKNIKDDKVLGSEDTFKMGEKYALVISLVIDEHFIANNSTTVSINEQTGYAAGVSADGKNVELYGFTIEVTDFRQPHTHTFGEEVKTVKPTCVEQGYDCVQCLTCGYLQKSNFKPTIEHDWDDGKETTAPTCTEKGKVTHICKGCKTTKVVDGS